MKTGDEYFDSQEFRDMLSEYEKAINTARIAEIEKPVTASRINKPGKIRNSFVSDFLIMNKLTIYHKNKATIET